MDPVRIYRSQTYALGLFLLALVIAVFTILVPQTNRLMVIVFWFVAASLVASAISTLAKREVVITIDQEGICLHPCLAAKLRWSRIVNAHVDWMPKVGKVLYVDVATDNGSNLDVNKARCAAMVITESPKVVRLGITIEGLNTSEAHLLSQIRSHKGRT